MPAEFEKCQQSGGKIRTKSMGDKYLHICMKGGKSYPGYIKTKKHENFRNIKNIRHEKDIKSR